MTTPLRFVLSLLVMLFGCESTRALHNTTVGALKLSRVVLYRNGVAYFERAGVVDGEHLSIKARKDQINDLLKSLTIIDRSSGKTVSVSVPLDPRAWQDAALSMLMPGRGRLAQVLDALRGTEVEAKTTERTVRGRIVLVEPEAGSGEDPEEHAAQQDFKLTLLDDATLHIVRLSSLRSLRLRDGNLIMQLDRHLDASSGEGMFQQVDVVVHFANDGPHDVAVSYVAEAPLWKPTYRLVLPDDNSGKALLQVWAVVSNVSGENWDSVKLSLTSGAPLAFRYDLHTPEDVERPDLTRSSADKRARVAVGETSFEAVVPAPPPAAAFAAPEEPEREMLADEADDMSSEGEAAPRKKAEMSRRSMAAKPSAPALAAGGGPAVDMAAWSSLQPIAASAKRVAGLTQFDVAEPISVRDGSASMVQLVNQLVPGEQTFLYKPGGSGPGYELNPYHVVRFQNDTDFVLEPGPLSIYASGSFVGEGLSEAIASHDRATIPFAAEPGIIVRSNRKAQGDAMHITKIVRGVLEVESFQRIQTTWQVEAKPAATARRVLVRQPRASAAYNLVNPPSDTEVLPDAYYIPVQIPAQKPSASVEVFEQTPSSRSLSIWDSEVPGLLQQLLAAQDLTPTARAALQPILELREAIGRIDSEVAGLKTQQSELDRRAEQERQNLWAIQKDPNAGALRKKLSERLAQLANEAAALGRAIVEKSSRRMEQQLALEDKLRDLDLTSLSRPTP
ncbi:MAG TPA: DUF4139 domain-containing protein [Polyangiales bacterium]|nr:DUF4139 domain-containing protein [Polyangiales bacterium]